MKTNLPVTQNEYFLRDDQLIVSKTDLKGCITYATPDFVEISGYAESELLGQSHNIVRHPDMPAEAFADLWATLKNGRPWIGLVKNRRKNGDYYWVESHTTPIIENGQTTGYLSLRRKPLAGVVRETEKVYAQFRNGNAGNKIIRQGRVLSKYGFANIFSGMSIKSWMWGLYALVASMLIGGAALGLSAMSHDNDSLHKMYEDRMMMSRYLSQINRLILDNNRQVLLALQHAPDSKFLPLHDHPTTRHTETIDQNIKQVNGALEKIAGQLNGQPAEFVSLYREFETAREKFINDGLKPTLALLADKKYDEANVVLLKSMNPFYAEVHKKITELQGYINDQAASEYDAQVENYRLLRNTVLVAITFALFFALIVVIVLSRFIANPMNAARAAFERIAQGKYDTLLDISRDDEAGKVLQGLETMQTKLGNDIVEAQRVAAETARIKTGLYSSTAAITISDENGLLQHASPRADELLKAVCGKDSNQLRGQKLTETVLTDPNVQAEMNAAVQTGRDVNVQLGDHFLLLSARPIIDELGHTLGRVTTWRDRTAEVRAEMEVEEIILAATLGEFDRKIPVEGKEGFYLNLAEGLNQISDIVSNGLSGVAEVIQLVAKGDLTRTIETEFEGRFGDLKEDTNTTILKLRDVIGQIKLAAEAINTAATEITAGNHDLSGRTEQQASSLEETASSMEELNSTVRNNAENSRQANELAIESNAIATRGGEMVGNVVTTMAEIQGSSRRIADIIGVIDGIAFQTNILALNAAVEAARAGEQGRGFAVVATEVRTLAQRSAAAAKEIKALIAESVGRVESGSALVSQAGNTMSEVVSSFQKVASLVTDISHASREQTHGIEQVTLAIGQIDEATQQNAALVEEAAAAAESLQEQVQGMVDIVGGFKLTREGDIGHLQRHAVQIGAPKQLTHVPTGGEGLDFDAVLDAHAAWKAKLREFIAGRGDPLDPSIVCRDDKCLLGQWIYGDGQQLSGDAEFLTLKDVHAQFHQCAGEIVTCTIQGDKRGASSRLGGEFGALTSRTITQIKKLREKYSYQPASRHRTAAEYTKKTVNPVVKQSIDDEWAEF